MVRQGTLSEVVEDAEEVIVGADGVGPAAGALLCAPALLRNNGLPQRVRRTPLVLILLSPTFVVHWSRTV